MNRTRNALIVVAGVALLALVIRFIDGRMTAAQQVPAPAVPDRIIEAAPAKGPKIYRMEAPLDELRKIPELDGMTRADELALSVLPPGVETAGRRVTPDEILEGYAHPNGRRFFIIMKAGTRAYSVFLD